jgi:hypothetical protein
MQIGDGSDPAALDRYGDVGNVRWIDEAVLAGSYYLVGNSLKAQLEAGWEGANTVFGWRQNLLVRLQIQFQF